MNNADVSRHDVMMSCTCACSGLLLRLQDWDPMICYGYKNCCGSNAIVLRRGEMTSSGYECGLYAVVVLPVISETDFGFWTMLDLGF